jgi:hypothetical protein
VDDVLQQKDVVRCAVVRDEAALAARLPVVK